MATTVDLTGTSWVVPAGVTSISVVCIGAGSCGVAGANTGGGAGGASANNPSITVTPAETLTIQIGVSAVNVAGTDSFIKRSATVLILAKGGSLGTTTTGGVGGLASGSTGTTTFNGGNGGNFGQTPSTGGGGGGGAGATAAGSTGTGSGGFAGNTPGGNGGNGASSGPGTVGAVYGGGGGGNGAGGTTPPLGGAGLVRVTYTTAPTTSTGTAAGTGTASGVGKSTINSTGTAAGTGTASGVGKSTINSTATAAGTSVVSGVSAAIIATTGTISGVGTASATSNTMVASVGTSSGTGTASGIGNSTTTSTATAAGTSVVSGVSLLTAASNATASGTSVVSGTGVSTINSTGTTAKAFPVVTIEGTTPDLFVKPSGTLAASNGQKGTLALLKWNGTTANGGGVQVFGFSSGTQAISLNLSATGGEIFLRNASGTVIGDVRLLTSQFFDGSQHDIIISWDFSQPTGPAGFNCYIDGSAISIATDTFVSGGSVGYNGLTASYQFGNGLSGASFNVGAFYLECKNRVDLTNSTNINNFNAPLINTDGSAPSGAQPEVFLTGISSQWNSGAGINYGSGAAFVKTGSAAASDVSGSAWGSGSVSVIATGVSITGAIGSSSGTGSATGVATAAPTTAVGTSVGTSTVSGISLSTTTAVGSLSGIGAAASAGASTSTTIGSSSGSGSTSATTNTTVAMSGTASGLAVSNAATNAIITSTGTTSGSGTASGTALSTTSAVGNSSGVGSAVAFVGVGAGGVGTTSGSGTASGTALSTSTSIATSLGSSSVSGVGTSTVISTGTVVGNSTAVGSVLSTGASTGTSSGSSGGVGVGKSTAVSTGIIAGVGAASGTALSTQNSTSSSNGVGTAFGTALSTTAAAGTSSGTSTASSVANSTAVGSASVLGTGTAAAGSNSIVNAVGTATGVGTGSSVTTTVVSAIGNAAGGSAGNSAFPIVTIEGTTPDLFVKPSGTLATTDGQKGTFALLKWTGTTANGGSVKVFGFGSGTQAITLNISATGGEMFIRNAAGTVIGDVRLLSSVFFDGSQHDIIISWDFSQSTGPAGFNCYVDGSPISIATDTFVSGGSVGYNGLTASYQFGNDISGSSFNVGAFYLECKNRVDLTNSTNISKFAASSIGTNGSTPSGAQPEVFLVGTASQWNNASGLNYGSGAAFVKTGSAAASNVSGSAWGSGSPLASAVGIALSPAVGTTNGSASASGVALSTASAGTSSGSSSVSGVGKATSTATGTAAGTSTTSSGGRLSPGAGWTGTGGTGYVSPPVDPTRTTAKPGAWWVDVPNRRFTSNFTIPVMAQALGGIAKVRFYLEGNTLDVTSPSFDTITDANGVGGKQRYGWMCPIDWTAMSARYTTGEALLYAEVFPTNVALQNKVIGPFRIWNASSEFSITKTIGPSGADYTTLVAAANAFETDFAGSNTWGVHPEFRVITSGDYPFAGANGFYSNAHGWITLTCAGGVTATLTAGGTRTYIRPFVDGIRLKGSGWHHDLAKSSYITLESTNGAGGGNLSQFWCDGINVIETGGKNALFDGMPPNTYWVLPSNGGTPVSAYFTDCAFSDTYYALSQFLLARGNTSDGTCDDFINVSSDNAYAQFNTTSGVDPSGTGGLRTPTASLSVTYSGAGTATLECDGASNTPGNRTVTAKINGSSVGTFTLDNPDPVASVGTWATWTGLAAFINGLANWSGSVQGTARGRAHSLVDLTNGPTSAFLPKTITSTPTLLYSQYDVHGDAYQAFKTAGGTITNLGMHFTSAKGINTSVGCQTFFMDGDTGLFQDCHYGYNEFAAFGTINSYSQINAAQHHVTIIAHTHYGQDTILRTVSPLLYNPDIYCSITYSSFDNFVWNNTPDTDLLLDHNNASGGSLPSGSTNSTQVTTLRYVNAPTDLSAGANMPAGVGARKPDGSWNVAAASSTSTSTGTAAGVGAANSVGTGTSVSAGTVAGTSVVSSLGNALVPSTASSTGSSTVNGTGKSTATTIGTVIGSSTAAGVAISTAASTSSITGLSGVSATGVSTAVATGALSGTGAASGVAASISTAVGSATGTSVINGNAVSITAITGTTSGTSSASATSNTIRTSIGSASGVGLSSAVGGNVSSVTGTSNGSSSASAIGAGTASATGSAAGLSSCSGVDVSTDTSVGLAGGIGSGNAASLSTATSTGTASGVSSVSSSSSGAANSTGSASGLSTTLATGTASSKTIGTSAGSSIVSGIGISTSSAVGSSAGSGNISGSAGSVSAAVGSSTGAGSANGSGRTTVIAVGSVGGVGSANAPSMVSQGSIGAAAGSSTVNASTVVIATAAGSASGSSSTGGTGSAIVRSVGISSGVSGSSVFSRTFYATFISSQSFTLNSISTVITTSRKVLAGVQTIGINTVATGTIAARKLTIQTASFVVTSGNTQVVVGRMLQATSQPFILSPKATQILLGHTISAASASFTITGPPIPIVYNRQLKPISASVTITTRNTNVTGSRVLLAASTPFNITPVNNKSIKNIVWAISTSVISITASTAALLYLTRPNSITVRTISASVRNNVINTPAFLRTVNAPYTTRAINAPLEQ